MDAQGLQEQWRRDGFVVVRNLLSPERARHLASLCDGIAAQWRECSPETDAPGAANPQDATCMRHLNHPSYFLSDESGGRVAMLETVADPGVLALCETILGDRPSFRSTSLFMNPEATSTNGDWHRDAPLRDVPLAPTPTAEEEGMIEANVGGGGESGGCVQLQIALIPSDDVELVSGSHLRWDTAEEWHVRLGDGKAHARSDHMPGACRIALQPGDGVAFNPFGLHRGADHSHWVHSLCRCTDRSSRHASSQPLVLTVPELLLLTSSATHAIHGDHDSVITLTAFLGVVA